VQILVVVANIQARSLRAEAEKGFARTAFGRELADPKPEINFEKGAIGARFRVDPRGFGARAPSARGPEAAKGKSVETPTFGSGARTEAPATSETRADRPGRVLFSF